MEQNKIDKQASFFMNKKASSNGGTISFIIGIVIVVIIVAKLALPSIDEATENLTGTEKTLLTFVGTLLVLFVIMMIVNQM